MNGVNTDAWLLRGISSVPGELRLRSATVSFIAHGSGSTWPGQLRKLAKLLGQNDFSPALGDGVSVELFAWPVVEISVSRPWYYFGGGIKLRRRGVVLRFGFGRPAGTRGGPGQALADFREVPGMRARGKLWASALAKATR